MFIGRGILESIIGIYGAGNVGQAVIERLVAFKPKKILYYDTDPVKQVDDLGAEYTPMNELLRKSDFIISTASLKEDNKHIFSKSAFEYMKKTAYFINTSKADLVQQKDLLEALRAKVIQGAAIDVTSPEPLPENDPLISLPNLVVTPHIGSSEFHVKNQVSMSAVQALLSALNEEEPTD